MKKEASQLALQYLSPNFEPETLACLFSSGASPMAYLNELPPFESVSLIRWGGGTHCTRVTFKLNSPFYIIVSLSGSGTGSMSSSESLATIKSLENVTASFGDFFVSGDSLSRTAYFSQV